MAQHYNPRVVTDGLVMHFDASLNKSYPDFDLPVKDGLILWLDAADDTTFSYSSGAVVSQWRDKSGLNNHVAQSTVANQPSRSSTLNSRKIIVFDGSNDSLSTANSLDLSTTHTIFAIASQSVGSSDAGLVSINNTLNNGMTLHNASGYYAYFGNGGYYATSSITGSTSYIFTKIFKGSSSTTRQIYLNGTSATSSGTITSTDASGVIRLGQQTTYLNGTIAEVIIFNRELTATELKQVHTYLGQKWGIVNSDRTIFDLSGNGYNALFGNGSTADMPLLHYYNQGGLKFNGKYALCPASVTNSLNGNALTAEVWVKHDSFGGASDGRSYINNWTSFNSLNQLGFILRTYVNQTFPSFWWCWGGANYYAEGPSSYVMQVGQIYHIVATYEKNVGMKIYINGNLELTTTNYTSNTIAFNTSSGIYLGYSQINTSYMDGNIYVAKLYNRALLASEVKQNYEAQKSRFANTIVEQNLVLNLDASNPFSYSGAGTTWYDVSTSNNNSILTNGPTYSSDSGGIIVFDGVDDYVNLNSGSAINNWNPDGINASTSYRSYTSANVWFKVSTISTGGVQKMIFSDSFMEYGFSYTNNTLYFIAFAVQSTTIAANTWYNACLVADVGRPSTGNYTQSGTTTITCTTNYPIPFVTGNTIFITFSSGTATSGNYVATVTGTYTFTITAASAATTSGGFYYSHSSNTSTVTAYLNGVQIGSPVTANSSNGLNDFPFVLGRDGGAVAGSNFSGSIALFQLYSKALSAAEVLQNYNATKGRFGL